MTQHQVAMATGLPQGTISYIERLKRGRAPNLDHARLIAAALGVTVDEIFPPAATKTSSVDRKTSQEAVQAAETA